MFSSNLFLKRKTHLACFWPHTGLGAKKLLLFLGDLRVLALREGSCAPTLFPHPATALSCDMFTVSYKTTSLQQIGNTNRIGPSAPRSSRVATRFIPETERERGEKREERAVAGCGPPWGQLGQVSSGGFCLAPVPGILQARTLEWVAISFSNA